MDVDFPVGRYLERSAGEAGGVLLGNIKGWGKGMGGVWKVSVSVFGLVIGGSMA